MKKAKDQPAAPAARQKSSRKKVFFGLRVRLTVLVCVELVFCVLLAAGASSLLDHFLPIRFKLPPILYLLVVSLLVGAFVTSFMSRWFFKPIKKLGKAMEQVAKGDFKVHLDSKSSIREMEEIYSGFNLMAQELNATEILQSDFVSNVSHEFKTPISAIEGYATLLQDCDNLNPEQRQYVEKINFNTKRLSNLVGNILLLSKLDNQHIPTRQTCFRLDEQIRQSIVMLESAWEKKDIELDVDMQRVAYTGNESILHHVWDNLIGNAIKFSPTGGTVRIGLKQQDSTVLITVEDEGPGISEEALKHIFDKFYQADSSHRQEGNGLGLALVKRILSVEGGDITAENGPTGGCRFTVTLHTTS